MHKGRVATLSNSHLPILYKDSMVIATLVFIATTHKTAAFNPYKDSIVIATTPNQTKPGKASRDKSADRHEL